ncbi:queuine tRNA-ribosyltransferase catalytic subunit 1-like isoform X2 [Hylaeus volcanicus]|uniref:queuine tRNA-ribosyltransferase catalytic subunit 1-like isoform X2 n=1 Tax=Hylaeus volcanicus TaxID=313075 RepID=UPI0023B82FB9|nr:queuine tRNA-ribosyltransferase catalytic subunit 1-like isoform X2 [Hylaeus volcanicus]
MTLLQLEKIGYQLILGNTYHLGNRPGISVLRQFSGLHTFMGWKKNILTDSGGFQMVSLLKLAQITEVGVEFLSPVDNSKQLLTPEMSMAIQNCIGADIMMALDDVIPATLDDHNRVKEATSRTTRWLDRCIQGHKRPLEQNLFAIVQGGLNETLRLQSLRDLKERNLPGYAIGGLSGGEEKDKFWRIVELCTRRVDSTGLPENKPRYLMGVGYPLDMIVSVAFGVDMFDCVYPARTARFGTAIVPEGTLRLKQNRYAYDNRVLQKDCPCAACKEYTRSYLHKSLDKKALGIRLLTLHNMTYMYRFFQDIRRSIATNTFSQYVVKFLKAQYHSNLIVKYLDCDSCKDKDTSQESCLDEVDRQPPHWVRCALQVAGISLDNLYAWE